MRIGEFSERNNITKDTVRHYIDLGLITPIKDGGQYYFDENCQQDIVHIFKLKDMGFTLAEIKKILHYKTLGILTEYQDHESYKDIFSKKHKEISQEITNLQKVKKELEEEIEGLSQAIKRKELTMGININLLGILRCYSCKGKLTISDGKIVDNQIIEGNLKCACGDVIDIKNGILQTNYILNGQGFSRDNSYIAEYINEIDQNYLNNIYQNIEWGRKVIDFNEFKGKVILDIGSGVGFFLRSIIDQLPDDCIYIAIDHDIKRHQFLKGMLEKQVHNKNIVFLCTDFLHLPLEDKSIDILLDISGSSNYAFNQSEFLLGKVNKWVKDNAILIGFYLMFKNFRRDNPIRDENRGNFISSNIKKYIKELKFEAIADKTSECLTKGGKYENYFLEGEKVFTYTYYGKR